jgi:hypothetical protein
MVQLGKRFGILMGVLVVVNAAGVVWIHHDLTKTPKPAVRLIGLSAQPSPAQARYVTLAFDRDLVAADRVGKVETDELFRLQPAWPGKWYWAARDRFEYRTDQPFPPGREFRIVRTDLLEARTGLAMQGPADVKLLTGPLALDSAQLTASDERDVTLTLTFNQPVDPAELARNLTFFDDRASSKLTAPQCLTKKPDAKLVVRTPLPVSGRLRMVIGEKLKGFQAQLPLGQAVSQVYQVSPGFALLAAEVQTPALEEVVAIRLRFTRPLGGEQKVIVPVVKPAVEKLEAHRSNNELMVSGEFQCEQKYTITIPGTLTSQGGATLGADKDVSVEIPNRQSHLTIPHTQGVLAPHGKLMLDARAVNVSQIHVSSWKLHANNLAAHLRGRGSDETSRSIREKTVKLDMPRNVPQTIAVDLADLVQDHRGVYGVEAGIVGREWNKCNAVVAVTDLAITAKEGPRGLMVWVTSLKTGQPAAGAEIKAVSNNNQILATGKTDEHGGAAIEVPANHPDGSTWLVTAEKDGDLSFLQLADNQWVIDEVDTKGRPRPETYEAMLYTERGVYRPGDMVHLTGILRDRGGQVPASFPLAIKVTRPDGRKVAELLAQPADGAQGVFHADFASRRDGQTGPYMFRVTLPGDKQELGATHASIEAFVPVRMEVKAKASSERYGPADAPRIEVSGRYLWDQPAAGVPLAVEAKLTAVAFESPAHKAFHFGSPAGAGGGKGTEIAAISTALDAQGKASLAVPLPKDLAAGLYKMVLSATVTEVGGRSVSAGAVAVVDRLDRHIGLRPPGIAPVGKAVSVDWVRLTGLAKPADAGEMKMTFSRVEYDTVLRHVDGRYVWQSTERLEQVSEKPIAPAGAAGSFEVTCPEAGMYRLAVADAASTSTTQLDFYASEYAAEAQSVEMNRPERLEIVTDKEKYVPGETAKVVVRSPLSGTLLLTLETDQVIWWQVAEVAKNTAELDLPIPADLRGGAFLVGTVVRAVDPTRKSWLPHRAMGMARVKTDHSARRLAVTVAATAKARPGENVTINVEGATAADPGRPAYVHLWAVDEGILLAAAYRTPDPMPFFLGQRGAGMSTSDIFSCLLPDYERPAGMTHIGAGGGEDDEAVDKLRRGPVDAKRLAPAVVWRAAAPAGPDGRLTVQMPMPDLTGQMRVMAVAVDGDRYGQAEHAMTLTTPLVVEATWPRFVAPDDTFLVPVKLFNSTDHPLTVRTEAHITGPVTVAADAELDHLVIRPGEPVLRFLQARATGVGDVQVVVEARPVDEPAGGAAAGGAAGEVLACHTTAMFPVRPAGTPHTETRLDSLAAGKNLPIVPSEAFVKGTIRATVDISPKPSVQLAPALERLIHYPYGCVEQTSSQLFSLLYAGDVLGGERAAAIQPMVQAGIARLWSMQTPSGGLAYWPGDTQPCLWGTAYASSCLLEARTAGHKIDEQFSKELTKYLAAELNNTGDRGDGAPDANTRALICRVLAAFGEPSHGWMARLAEQSDKLDQAGLAHLAGAYLAAGRKDRATELLPKEMPADVAETTTCGRLTSAVREDAVLLGVLMDIDPKGPLVVPLVGRLEKARKDGWWGSTLENASAVAALSRYQVLVEAEKPDFTGTVRAGEAPAVPFRHDKPFSQKFENLTGPIEIASAGAGTVYVSVAFEGLAQKGAVKPYERSLKVERKWLTSAGKPVDPEKLHVGDLVRVELTVRSRRPASNVAVVDCLPGGLEVENPRLATSAPIARDESAAGVVPAASEVPVTLRPSRHGGLRPTLSGEILAPDASAGGAPAERIFDRPDHVEFLDDRVVLFCSAGPKVQTFSYALRVTAAGEFVLPPIQASCMYDPAVACLGAEGKVKTAN